MGEQRPDDARVLVGQGHRRDVLVAPANQTGEPGLRMIYFAFCCPDYRAGIVNEQCPKISVTAFADAQQGLFAAARALSRHQPQPGGQLPTVVEVLRIADRGREGGFP